MKRIHSFALCVALLMTVAVPAHAFFFFFIPGSLFTSSDKKDVQELHKKMDWVGLRDFAQKKIDADANNADWWIQKAFANSKLNSFEDAVKGYQEAIRLQPSSYIAINDLGVVYQAQGKTQEALEQYLAALKVKPDFPLSISNAAALQYRVGRPDLTWDLYQQLTSLDPARAKALKERYLVPDVRPATPAPKIVAGTASIAPSLQVAQMPGPQNQPSEQEQIRKANDLWIAHNYKELLEFSESWSQAASNSPSAWYFLGLANHGLGLRDSAMPAFKEALRLKPDLPDSIGKLLMIRKDTGRIEEVYGVLSQIDPERAREFKAKYVQRTEP